MASRHSTEGVSTHSELVRDIGASRFRVVDDDADTKELMRLADNPLALHGFLQRQAVGMFVTPPVTRLVVPGLVLIHSSSQAQAGEPVYGAPEVRLQAFEGLEAFQPTAEDHEHVLMVWPEARRRGADSARLSVGMIVSVLVTSLVLGVLMFW
ncbi:hypothetical protein DK847_08660 [Aestuariivirga litoralis]|uniref:Uncharacterized protein n=1 Tax=Aestuariivirga litoralis TaxID=2650924 RepID=A0A2W2AUI6_9HYPH|nr:hypothetical protein [Aestuariivirga litoralis]PZF77382.1 hypothetical protein DK847_08660 [Aestuariivirga litoralis]